MHIETIRVVPPTLDVNLTLFGIFCQYFMGIIDLQRWNDCHLLTKWMFHPNFNHSRQYFTTKLLGCIIYQTWLQ